MIREIDENKLDESDHPGPCDMCGKWSAILYANAFGFTCRECMCSCRTCLEVNGLSSC